jgi:hypothetical protein
MIDQNLNNFSITDADMQSILDDLTIDMGQILAGLNFDIDSTLNILSPCLETDYLKSPPVEG